MTTETASITAEDALAAIDQCLIAVGDASWPTLSGVHVRADAEGLTFAAADGFQLLIVRVPGANPDRNEWTAIMDAPAIKAALPAIKMLIKAQARDKTEDRFPVTLAYAGADHTYDNKRGIGFNGAITLSAGLSTVTIPTISGQFPNYSQLVPVLDAKAGGRVGYNAGMVGKMLAIASKYAGSGIVRQRVQGEREPMRFDWRDSTDGNWTATAVIMPMFMERWD